MDVPLEKLVEAGVAALAGGSAGGVSILWRMKIAKAELDGWKEALSQRLDHNDQKVSDLSEAIAELEKSVANLDLIAKTFEAHIFEAPARVQRAEDMRKEVLGSVDRLVRRDDLKAFVRDIMSEYCRDFCPNKRERG
jgi:chromosome segregation ATPase